MPNVCQKGYKTISQFFSGSKELYWLTCEVKSSWRLNCEGIFSCIYPGSQGPEEHLINHTLHNIFRVVFFSHSYAQDT